MIYILYDTALNGPYTLMLLQNAYPDNQSLFNGTKDEPLSDVAPYLFSVDEKFFEKMNDPLVSLEAIVVMESEEKFKTLLLHFQQFIYQKINGQENYFRFWDARVLARFLPVCSEERLQSFFEGIKKMYVVDIGKETAKSFFIKRGKLQIAELAIRQLFVSAHEKEMQLQIESADVKETDQDKKTKRKFFNF